MTISLENRLKNYLNLYWLRPENALLCAFKSKVFEDLKFESPSLDLSCGDGLFMAIHNGGIFENDFDYFKSTKASNFNHSKFVDIYDHYEKNYEVKFVKEHKSKIDYGCDWKQTLLDKSSKLNLYDNLVLHDNNKTPLPFEDNFFKTIYSNAVYWVEKPEVLINDLFRITKPSGTVGLELMTPSLLETLDKLEPFMSPDSIEILNRQRRETMIGAKSFEEWNNIISSTDFIVKDVRIVYPHHMLIDIWNIGLRPVSHLLIQMSDSLSKEKREKIKDEWVEIFYRLFKPLLYLPETYELKDSPYLYYVLEKN